MFVCLQKDSKQCCDATKLHCTHRPSQQQVQRVCQALWHHIMICRIFLDKQTLCIPLLGKLISLKSRQQNIMACKGFLDCNRSAELLCNFPGRMKDEATLRDQKVTGGSKIMLIGSTVSDVMSVTAPDPKVLKEEEKKEAAAKEALSTQKV